MNGNSGFPNGAIFFLHWSRAAPPGMKAEVSEDEESHLPCLKGRQCHLETLHDRGFGFLVHKLSVLEEEWARS